MSEQRRPDTLANRLILSGCLLMLVPCVLGLAALLVFGWPIFLPTR